jgi:hypothetical protein
MAEPFVWGENGEQLSPGAGAPGQPMAPLMPGGYAEWQAGLSLGLNRINAALGVNNAAQREANIQKWIATNPALNPATQDAAQDLAQDAEED